MSSEVRSVAAQARFGLHEREFTQGGRLDGRVGELVAVGGMAAAAPDEDARIGAVGRGIEPGQIDFDGQ